MSRVLRVALLIADPEIRAGRRLILDSQPDLKVVFEESDAIRALNRLGDATIDVLVLDPRLESLDGLTFLRRYIASKQERGGLNHRTVVIGPFLAQDFVAESIAAGATTVVSLDLGAEVLLEAIRGEEEVADDFNFEEIDELAESVEYDDTSTQVLLNLHELSADEIKVLNAFCQRQGLQATSESTKLSASKVNAAFSRILEVFGFATKRQLAIHLIATGRMAS